MSHSEIPQGSAFKEMTELINLAVSISIDEHIVIVSVLQIKMI